MTPLCTRIYTHPFFEATPPGAAPGPPVKNRVPVFATSGGVTKAPFGGWQFRPLTLWQNNDQRNL